MKYITGILSLFCCIHIHAQQGEFETVLKGPLLDVSVEKVLYKNVQFPFCIRVQLKNTGSTTLGIYWKDNTHRLRPNQWGMHDTTFRIVIDERTLIPDQPDINLKKLFAARELLYIPAGQSYYYYIGFNAGKPGDVEKSPGKYFILSVDGQFWYTDKKKVYTLNFITQAKETHTHDNEVAFPHPLPWSEMPTGTSVYH